LLPATVTDVPTFPTLGDKPVIDGGGMNVKATPLLAKPLKVTITLPLVAPDGTETTIVVEFQLVGLATVPLNVTAFPTVLLPRLLPVIVTVFPTPALVGLRLVSEGGGTTTYDA
jgi:hypothetical protein